MEYDLDKEERAYALLQWGSAALLAPFDEALAVEGFYSSVQRKRSDAALDAWDKANPFDTNPELAAFNELESKGALTQADFYSPAKANRRRDGQSNSPITQTSYQDDLRELNARESVQESTGKFGGVRPSSRSGLPGERLAISNEKPVGTPTGESGRNARTAGRLPQSSED